MLLDDVHHASRHAGDVTDSRPSWSRHGQTDTRGHHEEIRTRRTVPDRVTQRLAEGPATSLGAVRRTLFVICRKGQFASESLLRRRLIIYYKHCIHTLHKSLKTNLKNNVKINEKSKKRINSSNIKHQNIKVSLKIHIKLLSKKPN